MSRDVRRFAAGVAALALSLCFALPGFGGGLDLIKQGQEAEKAGNRNAALEAYTQAISAGDLNGAQLAFAYYRRGGIHVSYDVFWPDERGAISRLRELR